MSTQSRNDQFIEPVFLPFGQIVTHNAKHIPEVVAMTQGDCETTWAEFDRYTNQVANGLIEQGLLPGARVAYLGKTTDEAFQILHGIAKARGVFTPLNWRLTAKEVSAILSDANAEYLFVAEDFLSLVEVLIGKEASFRKVIVLEGSACSEHSGYVEWREQHSSHSPATKPLPEDVILQLYTSGTTGLPKGALITQEYLMNIGRMHQQHAEDVFNMRPGEEYLNFFPMFHASGAITGQYPAFSRGCGIVIFPDFNPEQIFDSIDQRAIPILGSVPTMLQAFLSNPKFLSTDFSKLRYVMYGAAPMPIPLRDKLVQLLGCRFAQGYGATESNMISFLSPDDHETQSQRLLSVGQAMPGVQIKIVDAKGRELPTGKVGEIVIRSPAMAEGYWNRPEESAAAFQDGWYFTGDGGYLDQDGYLFLKERIKDLIISGGENIYPSEIENVLYAHPSVDSAAVVAVADEKWGEVPLAFIVVKEGCLFDSEELQEYANEKIARYKQPKYYEQIAELPLNASGKVLKKNLREIASGRIVAASLDSTERI